MIINHNIAALNTHRQLSTNTAATSKSIEKLSSGLRINRAGDDAAGLAISEKMRGQIRGLDMASKNGQDGISLIQTAEGALNETHSILQRMRELAVQSSNDTNTASDRGELQKEINQLTAEIDRIGTTTEFNTKKLLNGGASVTGTVTGANAAGISIIGGSGETKVGSLATITAATVATADNATTTATTFTTSATLAAASAVTLNGVTFSFGTTDTGQNILDKINDANIGVKAELVGGALKLTASTVGSKSELTISGETGAFAGLAAGLAQGVDATITGAGGVSYTAEGNKITIQSGAQKGLELQVNAAITAGAADVAVTANGGLNFQIGANEGQNMYVSVGDMRATALGVNQVDVSSATTANSAITTINNAIEKVSGERSKLGAYQNRLEHTINNLNTSSENLTAAESRVRDVDMAKEMMNQTKNNILAQAAQAMLAQANQQPQGVLQLLR
ncbi:flagellin [Paenibacillus sp. NRS-1760]|uniref:flagellin N-terminal helical domain-containing protein n=1 Tax=Paenibacillus sp. NRS-1760 TaxID=3233902 RepID=UPI003D29D5D5